MTHVATPSRKKAPPPRSQAKLRTVVKLPSTHVHSTSAGRWLTIGWWISVLICFCLLVLSAVLVYENRQLNSLRNADTQRLADAYAHGLQQEKEYADLSNDLVRAKLNCASALSLDPVCANKVLDEASRMMPSDPQLVREIGLMHQANFLPPRLSDGASLTVLRASQTGSVTVVEFVLEGADGHHLSRAHLQLRQHGRIVHQAHLSKVAKPLALHHLAVLFDRSDSIKHQLSAATSATSEFVSTMAGSSRIRVFTFGDVVTPLTPWTNDSQVLREAVQSIRSEGGTALHQGMNLTAMELATKAGRRSLVIISDGQDSSGRSPDDNFDVFCRTNSICVHTIAIDTPHDHTELLRSLAESTGGTFHAVSNVSKLADKFSQIALSLEQYVHRLVILEPLDLTSSIEIQLGNQMPVSVQIERSST